MTAPRLDSLVTELGTELAAGVDGSRVAGLLGAYSRAHDDWRSWALFDDRDYTRNLVVREQAFELLLLCWGPGQASPIHNHEGQDCWMVVLDGEIEEERYATPDACGRGSLEVRQSKVFATHQVGYIHDDIGLHLVRSARPDRPAVSLHLYAAPFDACNVYCPETGRISRKTFTNHSVRGRLLETKAT